MKKRIFVLIMAILCLSVVFAFASCGGGGDNGDGGDGTCQHTFGEWEVVTPKTCVASGLQTRTCSACGEQESEAIPAGHSFGDWQVTVNPDCTTDGSKKRTCTVCTAYETEKVVTQGHKKNVTTPAKEPTATENGCTEGAVCETCGEIISESQILVAYSNIATPDGTTVTKGESWHSFNDNKKYMFDGDKATTSSSPKYDYTLSIALKEGAYILDVTVVCNGGGTAHTSGGASSVADETRVTSVKITCFKDGKEVVSKTFDVSALKEAKLEGVDTNVDTIEIEVTCDKNNLYGTAYLWEINAYGTYPQTACEANGHDWGDWEETKAPVCTYEDELTDGEKKRVCGVCGEEEKEKVTAEHVYSDWGKLSNGDPFITRKPACGVDGEEGRECVKCYHEQYRPIPMTKPHNWGEWSFEGNCVNGGEKQRTCLNDDCGKTEKIPVEVGEHLNIITEGYIAPTIEAEGATGKTYCTICGEVFSESKVITKLVNHSSSATVGTDGGWAIDGSTGAPDTRPYLVDGNMNTGMTGYSAMRDVNHSLTWANAVAVNKIKLYFSGDSTGKNIGNLSGNLNNTNPDGTLTVTIYGADSRALTTVTIRTKDLTEYTIDFEEDTQITKINIKMKIDWNSSLIVNIWEVEALSGGDVTDTQYCSHDWSGWITVNEPTCEETGLEQRSCSLCNTTEENTIDAKSHSWGEWKYSEGFNCAEGGTRERTCKNNCGKVDVETVEAGEHIELVTEGYVAPTTEADGSTGTTMCTVCGQTVESAKVISKFTSALTGATVSTTNTHWHVTAQNGKDGLNALIDGNKENGSASAPDAHYTNIYIELAEATADLSKIILTVNGKGYVPATWANVSEVTNNNYRIRVNIYDESDNVIFESQEYSTLDIIDLEIDVELNDGASAKKIEIIRSSDTSSNYLWEVQALCGGKIVE